MPTPRAPKPGARRPAPAHVPSKAWRDDPRAVRPMLAALVEAPLADPALAYEPKYDGIRALIEIAPGSAAGTGRQAAVRLWSRLGNEKTAQFPEIVAALGEAGRRLRVPLLLDGEIVALDEDGEPAGFQRLQARMHLTGAHLIERAAARRAVALVLFDLLREGDDDLRPLPLAGRRARLERVFARMVPPGRGRTRARATGKCLRLSRFVTGDGRELYREAGAQGSEGLVAKDLRSPYLSGRRSPAWRKLKIVRRQEFVVGGWTDPRQSRQHFGALLLGAYPGAPGPGTGRQAAGARRPAASAQRSTPTEHPAPSAQRLIYVGSVGSGFDTHELARLAAILKDLDTDACPFAAVPAALSGAHWARPELVVEVRFSEWTDEGYLRHPVYLGQRTDKRAADVTREANGTADPRVAAGASGAGRRAANPERRTRRSNRKRAASNIPAAASIVDRLRDLEDRRRDGFLDLPDGHRLKVTNLAKVFWPGAGFTKGDLLRYYVEVAPFLLPAVAGRPLVMKRFPDGIEGETFYQQRAPERVPEGVEVVTVIEAGEDPPVPRLVGGGWTTLMYMAQLAAISQDPWFSRVQAPLEADYAALDLDPMEGVAFARVLDVARWIRDELEALGTPAVPKTSGARGLHIYVPLPPGTPYQAGLLFCQIVATVVAGRHPRVATVERTVSQRGTTVYIDYLQNIAGKTLAGPYSARASAFAGVSAPLTWKEVEGGVDPRDFTIRTMPGRLRETGDLWARLRQVRAADLRSVLRRYAR